MSIRMPRSSMAPSTGTSGISRSWKSETAPFSSSSASSTRTRRHVTSASSQAYSATLSTGTWSIETRFLPVPIRSDVGILRRPK